jgi:CheY-like chemotaxis protein
MQTNSVKTILVVEDEIFNFLFLQELLSHWHLRVIHALNGKTAVEICMTNPDIDLVLMDIRMPVLNGIEAAKMIRQIKPELPIVAQTAFTLDFEHDNMETIFDGYISKPINEAELSRKIKRFIHFSNGN